MASEERRTIEELVTRYHLESGLRDVYVEGASDAALIRQFLNDSDCRDATVYEISTVAVPRDIVEKLEVENNERGRVIALGMTLETKLGSDNCQVTCVVDSDFDIILQKEYDCRMVLFTDYTCLEMYLFSVEAVDKFFNSYLFGFAFSSEVVLSALKDTLQEVFLIRLANLVLKWNLTWLSFERCCVSDCARIQFNREDYVGRYLNSNGMVCKKKEFIATVEVLRSKLLPDPKCQMHGHDFIELFCWFIKKHANKAELLRPVVVRRSLSLCVSHEELAKESFFLQLMGRVRDN